MAAAPRYQVKQGVSGSVQGGKRGDDGPYFTTNEGHPFPDPEHSKTIGGLPLASDVFLFQKQQTFNRSKNLERMVHPCGSGAIGYFECTKDVAGLTKANFLSTVGEKAPIFVRFSTVTLGREFPDEASNPRGFAIKFYAMESKPRSDCGSAMLDLATGAIYGHLVAGCQTSGICYILTADQIAPLLSVSSLPVTDPLLVRVEEDELDTKEKDIAGSDRNRPNLLIFASSADDTKEDEHSQRRQL